MNYTIIMSIGIAFFSLLILSSISLSYSQTSELSKNNIISFSDNFRDLKQIGTWYNVSGIWNYTSNGLHGGKYDSSSLLNNVLISPLPPTNQFNVSTSFRVNDNFQDGETAHYASIVYSFINPQNYEHAGINIYSNQVYVVFSSIVNGTLYHAPTWLGIKTDLKYVPGTLFNISLEGNGSKLIFDVNGTKYSFNKNHSINNGYIGLNHGKIKSIDFYEFSGMINNGSSTEIGNESTNTSNREPLNQAINEQKKSAFSNIEDSITKLLEGIHIPKNGSIQLYTSYPYKIVEGYINAKVPCNNDSSSDIAILTGNSSKHYKNTMKLIPELSSDELCFYKIKINSNSSDPITDLYLMNNSTHNIKFPETSSITININKLSK